MNLAGKLHHVEVYVSALEKSMRFWKPFLTALGYGEFQKWDQGVSFMLDGTYLVFVQTEPKYLKDGYHRKRVGLNHLAFHAASRQQVDEIATWARNGGYTILYPDRHPYAGGRDYRYVLFCEDPDRIKVELVAPADA